MCSRMCVLAMLVTIGLAGVVSADQTVGNPNAGNGWSTASAVTATASGYQYTLSPDHAIDGSGLDAATGTMHNNELWDFFWNVPWNIGETNPHPGTVPCANWIAFEFDQAYPLTTMHVWNYNYGSEADCGAGAKDVVVEYSLTGGSDSAEWTNLGTFEVAKGTALNDFVGNDVCDFGEVEAKYVCVSILTDWGSLYGDQGIAEVQFNYIPEPITMCLLGLGGLALTRRRRA